MPLKLYMDEHVDVAITRGLRQRGIDVLTAQEDGCRNTDDPIILDRAAQLGRTFFTRDDDFLAEAHRRQVGGIAFAGVVYAHQLGATIGQCVNDLEVLAALSEPEEMVNQVKYIPLR